MCGMPHDREDVSDQGVCKVCADKLDNGRKLIELMGEDKLPRSSKFNQVLQALKNDAAPATVGLAEGILERLGGVEKLSEMMVTDVQKIRGEGLEKWEKVSHVTDYKVLKGMYEQICRILSVRDDLVKGAPDPMAEMDEEDLMLIAAEAAKIRLQTDESYRLELLELISQIDPQAVEDQFKMQYGMAVVRRTPGVTRVV